MSATQPHLVHEALIYSTADEFLARLVPFIDDGLTAGQPAIAVLGPDNTALLREALGQRASDMVFVGADALYRRPAAAIAEYRERLDAQLSARPEADLVRVVGEVRFGSSPDAHADWMRYEAMLNESFADYPAWIICPYDVRALPEHVVADAHCTHPFVSTGERREASSGYIETDEVIARPVPRESRVEKEPFARALFRDESELGELRRFVAGAARTAGLAPTAVSDVTVAAAELARDALRHGEASVEFAREGARWMCDVVGHDSGRTARGRNVGLSIARVISDRVELSAEDDVQTVRLSFSGAAKARQRILDAACELFYQRGIRATGTNAIIAHSGVSKATFFRHFPSKNDLVLACLEQPDSRWFDRIRSELESTTAPPARKLLKFFDLLGQWFAEEDFRGCAFQNAAAEAPDANHPVRKVVDDYVQEIQQYLQDTAADAGLTHPVPVAKQLTVLAFGAIATAVAIRSPDAAKVARTVAKGLLAGAE